MTLALAFVLGLMVGRHGARGQPPQTGSEQPRKSQPLSRRALSETEGERPPAIQDKLTFYRTLTAPLGPSPPPSRPEPKPAGEARDRAKAEAPPPLAGGPAAPAPAERYTVQVGAYRDRSPAEALERGLRAGGFEAYVAAVNGSEGEATYKVRVGSFASRTEALGLALRLRRERALAPFVTTR